MPKPSPSTYPKEQRWRFVQRFIPDTELIKFSKKILLCHGKKIDDILPELLSFVPKKRTGLKDMWLDIWVNLLHQTGLGYTWGKGKYLYATELCNFLAQTQDVSAYYTYWALKFQFPFSYPKQNHYIDNNVAIQPVVLILQHLDQIYELTKDLSKTFITKDEIVKFLMRSKDHTNILKNSKEILALRNSKYDYATEENISPGFKEAGDHFFSRGKLFLENIKLLKFSNDKILIKKIGQINEIKNFLLFVNPPVLFKENSQDMRNQYFSMNYNNLNPAPKDLIKSVYGVSIKTHKTRKIAAPAKIPTIAEILNPSDITGRFSKRFQMSRDFQAQLRKDLLILYNNACCICGLNNSSFLRAAHIVAVEVDPSIAADRSNCIILCTLHDIAFEIGLIYIDQNYKVQINKKHISEIQHPLLKKELIERENQNIFLPLKLKPDQKYLQRHITIHEN